MSFYVKSGFRSLRRGHVGVSVSNRFVATHGCPQPPPILFQSLSGRVRETTWCPPSSSSHSQLVTNQFSLYGRKHSSSTGPSSSSPWSSFPINIKKILLSVVGLVGLGYTLSNTDSPLLPQAYCDAEPQQNSPLASKKFNFIADVVEKASPSVVHITIAKRLVSFHGEAIVQAVNSGSGFVVEDGNYVLTNAHVVQSAHSSVEVELSSGQVVKGVVTDVDEIVDLAVIKLDLPEDISVTPLRFSNSSGLRTGEWVVAMGSPLSLTNTVTCGIISCLHRQSEKLGMMRNDMEYIQTDAAITHGNSGGPLVNLDGEVVGVNTMTATAGISFAIPGTVAENFVRSANKSVTGKLRYTIGIGIINLSPGVLQVMRHSRYIPKEVTGGVLVSQVAPNSPADLAGVRVRDVVVSINDQQVNSVQDIKKMVGSGKRLTIGFYRNHHYITCTVDPSRV